MNDMFKKVNAKEKLIGWYHSGPKLKASDLEINELFKRYTPNPLLVIVDVQPKDVGVPTDAYFAVDEIKDVRTYHAKGVWYWKLTLRRTAQRPPERSYIRPVPSRRRRRKRSVSSTFYGTSGTWRLAPSAHASHHSYNHFKACICGYKTSDDICRRCLTEICQSITPSSGICKTSSTCCPIFPSLRLKPKIFLPSMV